MRYAVYVVVHLLFLFAFFYNNMPVSIFRWCLKETKEQSLSASTWSLRCLSNLFLWELRVEDQLSKWILPLFKRWCEKSVSTVSCDSSLFHLARPNQLQTKKKTKKKKTLCNDMEYNKCLFKNNPINNSRSLQHPWLTSPKEKQVENLQVLSKLSTMHMMDIYYIRVIMLSKFLKMDDF